MQGHALTLAQVPSEAGGWTPFPLPDSRQTRPQLRRGLWRSPEPWTAAPAHTVAMNAIGRPYEHPTRWVGASPEQAEAGTAAWQSRIEKAGPAIGDFG